MFVFTTNPLFTIRSNSYWRITSTRHRHTVVFRHNISLNKRISFVYNLSMNETCKYRITGMCKNCGVSNNEEICGLCEKMKKCLKCTRRLTDSLFDKNESIICKTCEKKNISSVNRSAFNGAMQELTINIKGDDKDLEALIDNSRQQITENLQKTVEENKSV